MITVLVVVTFYEGFAFFAGYAFFNSCACIHNFVLNCIVSFGSNFFAGFKALFKRLFYFVEKATTIMSMALIGLTCLA